MKRADDPIAIYAIVLSIAQQMLSAAEQQDWQHFETLQALYSQHIETLTACSAELALIPKLTAKAELLITEIITTNHHLFNITKLWQDDLALKISSIDTEEKLQQAYQNQPY